MYLEIEEKVLIVQQREILALYNKKKYLTPRNK